MLICVKSFHWYVCVVLLVLVYGSVCVDVVVRTVV